MVLVSLDILVVLMLLVGLVIPSPLSGSILGCAMHSENCPSHAQVLCVLLCFACELRQLQNHCSWGPAANVKQNRASLGIVAEVDRTVAGVSKTLLPAPSPKAVSSSAVLFATDLPAPLGVF